MDDTDKKVLKGLRISVAGTVQGVGFRPWVFRVATSLGLSGKVWNHGRGVTIEIFGESEAFAPFLFALNHSAPQAARLTSIAVDSIPFQTRDGFWVEKTPLEAKETRAISIPVDMAPCADCLAEIHDPQERRFRYPFTNCTQCGPRFSIATGIPYDRPQTTMVDFPLCPECAREYANPQDRRFHAQPIACAVCGPRLDFWGGGEKGREPIAAAAAHLLAGEILAVKGIGGFHLACDAMNSSAVVRLRARKHRDEKPFAVMVVDEVGAHGLAEISPEALALLRSPARPIVLLHRKPGICLAPEVAPENPLIGLMLPYSPLHHLLLEEVRRPLVMTSGNLSEEPLAYTNEDAARRLADIADVQLHHDRPIAHPCDDSVARIIAGRPTVLRRSRGYVPIPMTLTTHLSQAVLACGAQLKNTFCLAEGKMAFLGPHIGDLDNVETLHLYEEAVERLSRFTGIVPKIIAHDAHPDYLSTRYALARLEPTKIAVQHHHAHVASAMAEHGLEGPVLGVAFDGAGLGSDGTLWGGEILLATQIDFQRLATLRPLRLAGGERAIFEVWRQALALLDDAFGEPVPLDGYALFSDPLCREVPRVRSLLQAGLNSPWAHGAGRYFDALGALGLARPRSNFEGQVAAQWNFVADPSEQGTYAYELDESAALPQIDLRPMVRELAGEIRRGIPPAILSARFHNTLAAATAAALFRYGDPSLPVVLTGGCLQNDRLAESLVDRLHSRFRVLLHGQVPPGDGGIALGQALVAAASAR